MSCLRDVPMILFLIGCWGRFSSVHHDVDPIALSENDVLTMDKKLLQLIGGKDGADVISAMRLSLIGQLGGSAVWRRISNHYASWN